MAPISINRSSLENEILTAAESEEMLWICPSCNRAVDEGICCDRCEFWYHYECQQLDDHEQSQYVETDRAYLCLACSFDNECEGLPESLAVDTRNQLESEPNNEVTLPKTVYELNRDDTHRKVVYEHGPAVSFPRLACTPRSVDRPPKKNSLLQDIDCVGV